MSNVDEDEDDYRPRILIQVYSKTHLQRVFSEQLLSLRWLKFVYSYSMYAVSVLQTYIKDSLCSWNCVISRGQPLQYWMGFNIPQFSWLVFWVHKLNLPQGESFAGSIIEQRSHHLNQDFPLCSLFILASICCIGLSLLHLLYSFE